jgi:hypothetical protein
LPDGGKAAGQTIPDSAFKYMTRPLYEAGSQNKSKIKRKEYSAYGTRHVARTFDENFQGIKGKEKEQQMCAKSSK